MNFSEAFKLSSLLCKFSPDGKYLVSGRGVGWGSSGVHTCGPRAGDSAADPDVGPGQGVRAGASLPAPSPSEADAQKHHCCLDVYRQIRNSVDCKLFTVSPTRQINDLNHQHPVPTTKRALHTAGI